jgi:hypothetical protein
LGQSEFEFTNENKGGAPLQQSVEPAKRLVRTVGLESAERSQGRHDRSSIMFNVRTLALSADSNWQNELEQRPALAVRRCTDREVRKARKRLTMAPLLGKAPAGWREWLAEHRASALAKRYQKLRDRFQIDVDYPPNLAIRP